MGQDFASEVQHDFQQAYYAERNGDLTEALRLYRLISGYYARLTETEKDGMRMRFGDLQAKIKDLQLAISQANGAGALQRVPVLFTRARLND